MRQIHALPHFTKTTAFFLAATLAMVAMVWYGSGAAIEYSPTNTEGITFIPGRVVEVVSDETELNEQGLYMGRQDLRVELLEGERAGEVIDVRNTLSVDHSYRVAEGQRILVCLDQQPDSSEYFAMMQSPERSWGIYAVVAVFLCLLALVGRKTGVRSAFGLVFTFVVLIFLLVPLVIQGAPPVWTSIGLVFCIAVVSLISVLGFEKKTYVSILATASGLVFCCIFYALISWALHITGYNVGEIDSLIVVAYNTNIQVGDLLFVGVLIASLGAVMDVSVSVATSVAELRENNPVITFDALFRSGMVIGRDIIGSTMSTLIMAFAGAFFISLVMFRIYNVQFYQLINLEEISIEILQALASASALILCAPITAFLAARFYSSAKPTKSAAQGRRR